MARYRKIDPRIWNDAKFRELSDEGKLVFFMLLTHPNMTALGAMRATLSGLSEELGWQAEAFREAFQEVFQKGMAEHDQKACLIALPKFIKYNPPESPNVIKAWGSALDLLPECPLKERVIAGARRYAESLSEGFTKALPEAFAKSMPNQEQEQEQEQNKPIALVPREKRIEWFESLWSTFDTGLGQKGSKKKAQAQWEKLKVTESLFTEILLALVNQIQAKSNLKDRGQFWESFPHVERWLRDERWKDEISEDEFASSDLGERFAI